MKNRAILYLLLCLLVLFTAPLAACTGDDPSTHSAGSGQADDDSGGADDDAGDDATDDDDDDDDVLVEPCPGGPVFDFDTGVTPMVVPYPNDLYTVSDEGSQTGLRVRIDENVALPLGALAGLGLVRFLVNAINTQNGFSTAADLYVPVSIEPDPQGMPDEHDPGMEDGVFLVVDDEDSPFNGEFAALTSQWKAGALHLRPFFPLRENSRYILAATTALIPEEGECYQPSEEMRRIREEYAEGSRGLDPGNLLAGLARLEEIGVRADQVLSLSVFHTLNATKDLDEVRGRLDELAGESAPEIEAWEFESNSHPDLEGFATANLLTPIFQDDAGHWTRNPEGELSPRSWQNVRVLFSLPSPEAHPAGQPYPVVLYGHGVGDTLNSLRTLSLTFARHGFVLAGMDFPCHGLRAPIPDDPTTSVLCYFNFLDPLNFRDNLRETVAGLMWLARAVKTLGDIDMIPEGGDGIPDFDVEKIYFLGMSVGAINGGTFSALEENVDAFVLSSAGAKFSGIAIEGNYMAGFLDLAELLDQFLPNLDLADMIWVLGGMFQHILDPGDPINFLPHTIMDPLPALAHREAQVLQQGAAEDFMLGGIAGAYAARAGGWPQLEPYVWDVGGVEHAVCPYEKAGFYQFDSDDHFALWSSSALGEAVREQALHFLETHRDTGVGEIIDPFAAGGRTDQKHSSFFQLQR